jgi:hypothetical protein
MSEWTVGNHQENSGHRFQKQQGSAYQHFCPGCGKNLHLQYAPQRGSLDVYCHSCRQEAIDRQIRDAAESRAIGAGPRPRFINYQDKKLYLYHRAAWLQVAQHRTLHNGERAAFRNRCRFCQARALKNGFGGPWCLRCRTIHRLTAIRKMVIRPSEFPEAVRMAGIWGMEDTVKAMAAMDRKTLENLNIQSVVAADASSPTLGFKP